MDCALPAASAGRVALCFGAAENKIKVRLPDGSVRVLLMEQQP
jgi:ribosomal protein L2